MKQVAWAHPLDGAAADGIVDCALLFRQTFGWPEDDWNSPAYQSRQSTGLLSMAYLFARFGAPQCGHDDVKELCAYLLTTEMPGLYLRVAPSGSSLDLCMSYRIERSISRSPIATSATTPLPEQIVVALRDVMAALEQPVWVDDVAITITGFATRELLLKWKMVDEE